MVSKFKKAFEVLQEAWLLSRVPRNESIFRYLSMVADDASSQTCTRGFRRYLKDYPAIGHIETLKDWYYDEANKEIRLMYSNRIFAHGCLRIRPGRKEYDIIVFLPGNQAGADDVLGDGNHLQNMTNVADELGMGIATWDWPLQGERRDRSLYNGFKSIYSGEREYSRIFPVFGTSLWREKVAELQFALKQIRRYIGYKRAIHVVGWSMGGCFAYLTPLLGSTITTTVSAGSCARIKDLLSEGKTRLHGYFFYPLNGLRYFDLEDIAAEVLNMECPMLIIHGEDDAGCLESTRKSLNKLSGPLQTVVLPGHGHVFSEAIKSRIIEFLSRNGRIAD